ncbi:MAG TPA: hypothetical protein VFM58_07410, partial [Solirubrobacteraceae bacterium]|nr:hypothetical protein [Solirubrobacteraceae bacterium]
FTPAATLPSEPVHVGGVELRAVLDRLRQQALTHVEQINTSFAATSALARRSAELRERCVETRARQRRVPRRTA